MKAVFIVPRNDDQHQPANQLTPNRIFPPVGLARMAGITGKHATVSLIDERIEEDAHIDPVQIAIIFVNSYNQQRACDLAWRYRALGACVVMTGMILSNLPDFPAGLADCLFIGSGEDYMEKFLVDYQAGKVKAFYRGSAHVANTDHYRSLAGNMTLRLAS